MQSTMVLEIGRLLVSLFLINDTFSQVNIFYSLGYLLGIHMYTGKRNMFNKEK